MKGLLRKYGITCATVFNMDFLKVREKGEEDIKEDGEITREFFYAQYRYALRNIQMYSTSWLILLVLALV